MSIETQQELAAGFVSEVVARFGIEATTQVRLTEDDGIFVSVETISGFSWARKAPRLRPCRS